MNKLLIFDFNNLLFKGLSVHETLEFGDKKTGGLYGFIIQFCAQINLHSPDRILICNDQPPYFRKELYPQYKEGRGQRDPESWEVIQNSRSYCRDFLEEIKIPLWEEKGFEADDLIAEAVETFYNDFESIIIVSNDDDLFQLFRYSKVQLQRGKVLFTKADFNKKYPTISPRQWIFIKAIVGTHNAVEGIKGIGEKTALKIIHDAERYQKVLADHHNMIWLNKKLITLPFPEKEITTKVKLTKGYYSEGGLSRFLAGYGIEVKPFMKQAFRKIGGEF